MLVRFFETLKKKMQVFLIYISNNSKLRGELIHTFLI